MIREENGRRIWEPEKKSKLEEAIGNRRRCAWCGEIRNSDEDFYLAPARKDKLDPVCKICRKSKRAMGKPRPVRWHEKTEVFRGMIQVYPYREMDLTGCLQGIAVALSCNFQMRVLSAVNKGVTPRVWNILSYRNEKYLIEDAETHVLAWVNEEDFNLVTKNLWEEELQKKS